MIFYTLNISFCFFPSLFNVIEFYLRNHNKNKDFFPVFCAIPAISIAVYISVTISNFQLLTVFNQVVLLLFYHYFIFIISLTLRSNNFVIPFYLLQNKTCLLTYLRTLPTARIFYSEKSNYVKNSFPSFLEELRCGKAVMQTGQTGCFVLVEVGLFRAATFY